MTNKPKLRVVVTGASGRIGRAVCRALRSDGLFSVISTDIQQTPNTDWQPFDAPISILGDICQHSVQAKLLAGADAVVHVAGLHAPHVGNYTDADFMRINLDATQALAQAADLRAFVFTSTTALFGGASQGGAAAAWISMQTPPQPRTIYHRSKLLAEQCLQALSATARTPLKVRVLRISRCFPEPANLMALYRLHRGVDARDVAAAHVFALKQALAQARAYADYLVSAATPFLAADASALKHDVASVLALREPALLAAFAARGWLNQEGKIGLGIDRIYDPSETISQLGWQPHFGWQEVLHQLDSGQAQVLPATLR
jgi:UDP-glucose 4-epimerase